MDVQFTGEATRPDKCQRQKQLGQTGYHRLRYYMHDGPSEFRFELAGVLGGDDVLELKRCWFTALSIIAGKDFIVELSSLTAVDEAGHQLLQMWYEGGARLLAKSGASCSLVESITGQPFAPPAAGGKTSKVGWALFRRLAFSTIMFLMLSLVVPLAVFAGVPAETTSGAVAEPALSPAQALARYAATVGQSGPMAETGAVAVEIEASLPRISKQGRLRAIRRPAPFGRTEYQAIQIEGDPTVKHQLIARYLSAEAQAEALPSSCVAVTAQNYRFRYAGSIRRDETVTYIFQITPRKRRVGLMEGQLWIDGATGFAVHQTGRLVKQPSVFLRDVQVTQDTDIREGRASLRVTHLEIDTRLVGRAELTIMERPYVAAADQQPGPGPESPIANAAQRMERNEVASFIADITE